MSCFKRRAWLLSATTTLLFFNTPCSGQAQIAGELNRTIPKLMAQWKVPGMALAVFSGDSVIHLRGYGVLTAGTTDSVGENTVFAVGSITKSFTSAALGLLVRDNRLAWDAKIKDLLVDWNLADTYRADQVTVRDILAHRTSLSRADSLWFGSRRTRGEILAAFQALPGGAAFRDNFIYNNVAYLAAAAVVERVTGRTWDDAVSATFFQPLGMSRTSTSVAELHRFADVATPHRIGANGPVPIEWMNIDNMAPAGSINASASDMVKWLKWQVSAANDPVLKEMHAPQTVVRPKTGIWAQLYPTVDVLTYGLGWFIHSYYGHTVIEHGGVIPGMRAQVAFVPKEQIGIVILTNAGYPANLLPEVVKNQILDAVLGIPPQDWNQRFRDIAIRAAAN